MKQAATVNEGKIKEYYFDIFNRYFFCEWSGILPANKFNNTYRHIKSKKP